MSLQIWLPLIEDLHNQGLSNLTFHNIGNVDTYISQSTDGKLGKCYMNNAVNAGGIVSNETINLNGPQSMFCWVNFSSLSSSNDVLGAGVIGNHDTDEKSNISLTIIKPSNVETTKGTVGISVGYQTGRNYGKYYGNTVLNTNTWYHIGFTYSGTTNNTVTFYVNGQQDKIVTLDETPYFKANYFEAFAWSTASSNRKLNGKINDIRIYDHCLSAKEVEEISKGLVVHYMLSPQNLIGNLTTGQVINSAGNTAIPSNTAAWAVTDYISVIPGSTYLAEQLSAGGSGGYIGLYNSSKTNTRTISITANQSNSVTIADTESYIRLSVRTTSSETSLTPMFYQTNGTVYDCSGYCNNGNIIGNITYTSPSPRYSNAIQFDGTSNAIAAGRGGMIKDAVSVAWWGYMDDWSNFKKCISSLNSGGYGFEPYSSGTRLGFSVCNLNSSNTATVVRAYTYLSSVTANCWHHFVGTFDGNNVNLYKNGELVNSTTALNNKIVYNETNGLFIGAEAGNSATVPAEWVSGMKPIKISDFRIYSTALTENQVKELYNTSMAIDANGNIFARELVEE